MPIRGARRSRPPSCQRFGATAAGLWVVMSERANGEDSRLGGNRHSLAPGTAPRPGRAEGSNGPARILIVEDEWFIATESEAVLREAGFDVVGIAVSAEEAVELTERHRPDLVLMDIRLRGARNGVEAAREIRQRFDIACLFATAHSEESVRADAEAAAPAGWLAKPFSDRQLVAAVKAALAG
jgi:two-component system, response regulator PdtaR